MEIRNYFLSLLIGCAVCFCISLLPDTAAAHCDTLDGPVVTTAKMALEKSDVAPILKWVKKENEGEIKEAFNKTLAVRKQSKEAKELADMYFFETLVRIHRAGEGAPYTGLTKEPVEPVIAEADKSLESGSADNLIKMATDAVANGIRKHFSETKETKIHSDESVEAGRKFVEAYVEFTHYVERLYLDASGPSGHAVKHEASEAEGHRHH